MLNILLYLPKLVQNIFGTFLVQTFAFWSMHENILISQKNNVEKRLKNLA